MSRKTPYNTKSFKEALIKKFPDYEDYYEIIEDYTGWVKKILLKTKYGLCRMKPNGLMLGRKPAINSALDKTQYFINHAIDVHGDIYDYSKSAYIKALVNIVITCKDHGDFLQNPNCHLDGQGCPICGIKRKTLLNTYSTEEFIERSKIIHGEKYNYDKVNYVDSHTKVCIICPKHGDFFQLPPSHLRGFCCKKCGFEQTAVKHASNISDFIEKANKVHNSKYDYSKSVYIKRRTKLCIICPIDNHLEFYQEPSNHLSGAGCPKCANLNKGFKLTDWINRANGREGIFYIIRCWNENEEFYKVGITLNTVRERYPNRREMPYNYEIIYEEASKDLKMIYYKEINYKRLLKQYKYRPLIYFSGCSNECFNKNPLNFVYYESRGNEELTRERAEKTI